MIDWLFDDVRPINVDSPIDATYYRTIDGGRDGYRCYTKRRRGWATFNRAICVYDALW